MSDLKKKKKKPCLFGSYCLRKWTYPIYLHFQQCLLPSQYSLGCVLLYQPHTSALAPLWANEISLKEYEVIKAKKSHFITFSKKTVKTVFLCSLVTRRQQRCSPLKPVVQRPLLAGICWPGESRWGPRQAASCRRPSLHFPQQHRNFPKAVSHLEF